MSSCQDYLQPGFMPSDLTVTRLKEILKQNDVGFRTSSKKADLVQLFEEKIRNRSPQILTENWVVRQGNQSPPANDAFGRGASCRNGTPHTIHQVPNNRSQQHSPKIITKNPPDNSFILQSQNTITETTNNNSIYINDDDDDDDDELITSKPLYQQRTLSKINGSFTADGSSSSIKTNESITIKREQSSLPPSPPSINEPPSSFSNHPVPPIASSQVLDKNSSNELHYDILRYCWFGTEIYENIYIKRINRIPHPEVLYESERDQRNKIIKKIILSIFIILLFYHRIKNYAGYCDNINDSYDINNDLLRSLVCIPCPGSSNCVDGKIVSCVDGYKILKSDFSIYEMASNYCEAEMGMEEKIAFYSEALKRAAILQHEKIVCNNESRETMNLKNLKSKIRILMYKDSDEEFENFFESGFEKLKSDPDLNIGFINNGNLYDGTNFYIFPKEETYTIMCTARLKGLITNNPYYAIGILFHFYRYIGLSEPTVISLAWREIILRELVNDKSHQERIWVKVEENIR
ncbi:4812_t:CDS:2, partial [Entrophospora sp. SA101]